LGEHDKYSTYALIDPSCEATVDEYESGCLDRRCSMELNKHDKVCFHGSQMRPGSLCSVNECRARCASHARFPCVAYSFEAASGECYVFDVCFGEGFQLGYNTYVLIDPTCENSVELGGCPGRLCSQQANEWLLLCSGTDLAHAPCTLAECAAKVREQATVAAVQPSHFAFDSVVLKLSQTHLVTIYESLYTDLKRVNNSELAPMVECVQKKSREGTAKV